MEKQKWNAVDFYVTLLFLAFSTQSPTTETSLQPALQSVPPDWPLGGPPWAPAAQQVLPGHTFLCGEVPEVPPGGWQVQRPQWVFLQHTYCFLLIRNRASAWPFYLFKKIFLSVLLNWLKSFISLELIFSVVDNFVEVVVSSQWNRFT